MAPPVTPDFSVSLGELAEPVDRRLRKWRHDDIAASLVAKEGALWSVAEPPELLDRLGWLDLPRRPQGELAEITQFSQQVREDGFSHVVVLGMGGSSLAPEVFAQTFGAPAASLEVLDSTHPSEIRAAVEGLDLGRTFFVVASKSGSTLETLSLFRFFRQRLLDVGLDPAEHMVAITDPGSALSEEALSGSFLRVWEANPEVGGRYSALTRFGLLPASLCGVDIGALVARAGVARDMLDGSMEERIEVLRLGAILGEAAVAGRNKLTFVTGRGLQLFPDWIEQLVAESLGKRGRGVVPVINEPIASAKGYGADRLFVSLELAGEDNTAKADLLEELRTRHPVVRIELAGAEDLGFEMFRWQVAVASAATILGVHPFNQPDVEAAKRLARLNLQGEGPDAEAKDGLWEADFASEEETDRVLKAWLRGATANGYFGIHAYLPRSPELDAAVRLLRAELTQSFRLATTFGYGPRFLHSTGQLHKGGPNNGLFLQLVDVPDGDLSIPESETDFGAVIQAQARGDAEALYSRRQWVLRVQIGNDAVAAVERLTKWLAAERLG